MEPLIQKLGITQDEANLLLGGILRECNMRGTGHKDYMPAHRDISHQDYTDHTAYTDYQESDHHLDHQDFYNHPDHSEYPYHKDHWLDLGS